MSRTRVFIWVDGGVAETEVHPIWSGEVIHAPELNQVFYRKKFTQLIFEKADHCLILGLEPCDEIKVKIEVFCDGEWLEYVRGKFTHYDCEFDLDNTRTTVVPTTIDIYTCFLEKWETEINIYNCGTEVEARGMIGTYQAGLFPCMDCRGMPYDSPCNDHNSEACVQFSGIVSYPSPKCPEPNRYEVNTTWHREVGIGTSTTPPPYGTGWTHLSGNSWWRCPYSAGIDLGVFKYGRMFNAALEYTMAQYACDITTQSHFFDFNATHAAPPGNAAYTFAAENLEHITLHQKSDVKRPDGNKSFSKVWTLKAKDLLDDLREVFNVYWKLTGTIEEPVMILEHISYFEEQIGLDFSGKSIRRQYKQDDTGAPSLEKWIWSDEAILNNTHAGRPIEYNCGGDTLEHRVKLFTNDVISVKASVNAENISDKNYVLMANYRHPDTGQLLIFPDNEPLGLWQLHDKLHRHNRYFEDGTMNGTPTTFTTFRKTRRLKQFTGQVCCDQNFNPEYFVLTMLGPGKVAQAAHNLVRNQVKFDLTI